MMVWRVEGRRALAREGPSGSHALMFVHVRPGGLLRLRSDAAITKMRRMLFIRGWHSVHCNRWYGQKIFQHKMGSTRRPEHTKLR